MRLKFSISMMAATFVLLFGLTSCAHLEETLSVEDRVLVYDLPYDLTYLNTLEALQTVEDWELAETEMEKGMITISNRKFSTFDDADKRLAVFLVKRLDKRKTSVQLAPESQQVIGGKELMQTIEDYFTRSL